MPESLAKGPLQLTTVRGDAGCDGLAAPMERAAGGVSICCADSEPATVMASPATNAAPIDRPRIACLDAICGYSSTAGCLRSLPNWGVTQTVCTQNPIRIDWRKETPKADIQCNSQ